MLAGIEAAIKMGNVDAEVVALEARRHHDAGASAALIVPIGARLSHRPPPRLEHYDELLGVAR